MFFNLYFKQLFVEYYFHEDYKFIFFFKIKSSPNVDSIHNFEIKFIDTLCRFLMQLPNKVTIGIITLNDQIEPLNNLKNLYFFFKYFILI